MSEATRRMERERVLGLLYEAEMKNTTVDDVLASLPVPPEDFVVETVTGVQRDQADLDTAINRHAIAWNTERMAAIDHIVLRIGAWELMRRPNLPVAVAISEAVELAKRFSTEESGKFVNGILSALAGDVRQAG